MMTSEQVYEMAAKLNESKVETNPEVETTEEVQPAEVETNTIPDENENVSDETVEQETTVESEEKPQSDKKQLTPEDKQKYAFAKLKNKERQKRDKLISDYENKIKTLNAELTKYKDLQKDYFKSDEDYMQYLVDQKMKQQQSNSLQIAKAQMEAERFEEKNQQRIAYCFPDEKDREVYNKLIETSAPKFVQMLEQADPDDAVLSYLDDSDIAPLLIRVLMTKPELRNEVLSKSNPYSKVLALDNLAKRLTAAKSIVDRKRAGAKPKSQTENNKSLPIIGKVARSESATQVDKNDPNYWNKMLHDLNAKRR